MPTPHGFGYCSFIIRLEISVSLFLFQIIFNLGINSIEQLSNPAGQSSEIGKDAILSVERKKRKTYE